MNSWLRAQVNCEEQNRPYVLVSIVALTGSSPRGVGSKMVVTADHEHDTIGGGHLEYKAIAQARSKLAGGASTELIDYALGASLGQCCGGKVSLMFEVFSQSKMPVVVFGAGHVGRALVPLLAQLPVQVTWVDGRYDMLPKDIAVGVNAVHEEHPQDYVDDCIVGTCYLIMTHHHGLDLALTEAVIKRSTRRTSSRLCGRLYCRHLLLDYDPSPWPRFSLNRGGDQTWRCRIFGCDWLSD